MSENLREAAQQALDYMKSVGQLDMYLKEYEIVGRLEAALAEPTAEDIAQDWDLLKATQESLREHMAEIQRLRAALSEPEPTLSQKLVAAGFSPRDRRLTCDVCGGKFGRQILPIHKCPAESMQEPVACIAALKDAFFEGFTSVATYNDTLLNSPEEAWGNYKPPQRPLLADEEIAVIEESCMGPVQYGGHENMTQERVFEVLAFARALERKIRGEKE